MKITKSKLKQIIKEEIEKVLEEGGSTADVKGTDLKVPLHSLTNLAMGATESGVTKMDKQLDNGIHITVVSRKDPNWDPGAEVEPGNVVDPGKAFLWPGAPGWQWVITPEGGQLQLPLEEPPEERKMSPSLFSRIRGAMSRGDKEQVAELLKQTIKEELENVLNEKEWTGGQVSTPAWMKGGEFAVGEDGKFYYQGQGGRPRYNLGVVDDEEVLVELAQALNIPTKPPEGYARAKEVLEQFRDGKINPFV
jgi:hypothetical protein